MNLSNESFQIILFLVPGFLSSALLSLLVVRRKPDNLERIFESLIFSLIILLMARLSQYGWTYITSIVLPAYGHAVTGSSLPSLQLGSDMRSLSTYLLSDSPPILLTVFFSVLLPIIFSYSITHDVHMRWLRSLNITNKTARESVWFDTFTDLNNRIVIVNFKDGRRVIGWPQYYSNTPDEGVVYLYNHSWIDGHGDFTPGGGHGILVSRDATESLEFQWLDSDDRPPSLQKSIDSDFEEKG